MGEAIAHLFAEEGAKVALVDVQEDAGEAVAATIRDQGGSASFLRCDVSQDKQVQESITEAVAKFGGLDIAVNNAGIVRSGATPRNNRGGMGPPEGVNLKSISPP